MAGRYTQNDVALAVNDLFKQAFTQASDGKPALAVTNTDGTTISGGGGGGGAVTVADGADVTQGAIADAVITAGAAGTVSAKLRAISRDVGSILTNTPALGQAAMAASAPVVIASNQSAVPVSGTVTTTPPANASTNIAQINGVTPLMGNGVTGTGSLRVTIASDNTSNSNAWLVQGGKTNNNAAPGATNLGSLPAVANAAAPTWTEGNQVSQSSDLSGNQRVTLGTLIAGEDLTVNVIKVEQRFTYAAITSATTTTIKSGTGFLHAVTVTGGTAGTITVFDNTAGSGTAIATFSSTNALATYIFDVSFSTGLTVVTGAATNVTVSYR